MYIIINNNKNHKGFLTKKLIKLFKILKLEFKEVFTLKDLNAISNDIKGIILSGSYINLTSKLEFNTISHNITAILRYKDVPILGICFGCQIMAMVYGGIINKFDKVCKGIKNMSIITNDSILFKEIKPDFKATHSHSIFIAEEPKDFEITARSSKNIIQAIESIKLKRFGIQFHLESDNTEYGIEILKNFIKFCEDL